MFDRLDTPMAALARGLTAGVLGTTAMTAAQVLPSNLQSSSGPEQSGAEEPKDPWAEAPVPALVGRRILEGIFHKEVTADDIPLLTNAMHWGYGTAWGTIYGLIHSRVPDRPLRSGVEFGLAVWAMSYVQLVPMGLYEPPWKYSPKELAMDVGYHVAYGAGLGVGHRLVTWKRPADAGLFHEGSVPRARFSRRSQRGRRAGDSARRACRRGWRR